MDIPKELKFLLTYTDVLLPGGVSRISVPQTMNVELIKDFTACEGPQIFGVMPCKDNNSFVEGAIGVAAGILELSTVTWNKKSFIATVIGLKRVRVDKLLVAGNCPVASVTVIKEEDYTENEEFKIKFDEFKSKALHFLSASDSMYTYFAIHMKRYKRIFGDQFSMAIFIDVCAQFVANSLEEKLDILRTTDTLDKLKKVSSMFDKISKPDNTNLKPLIHLPLGDENTKDKFPIRFSLIGTSPVILKKMKRFSSLSPNGDEDDELEEKLRALNLPEQAAKVVKRELNQLKRLNPHHLDYAVHRNYLELVADLPWNVRSNETINIAKSRQDLEIDHYGMDKVKRRLLEYLAVRLLKADLKGPILCLVGAPGVGKTSVARSIANSLGRKFHRISLGGISNHSDIRGHRRTYVGAMPGRIIHAIRIVAVKNPVILLDEIDKLGKGLNGDPASALLEVLDSEQNSSFVDSYLNIPFDLSEVIFIATANTVKTIPAALKDRLELIQMPGYTLEEKKKIAERHLLPKQLNEHGLPPFSITLPEDLLNLIISGYTREAGVRSLERKLASICRRAAINMTSSSTGEMVNINASYSMLVTRELLEDILGPVLFEGGMIGWKEDMPGMAVGLCWTQMGGDIMLVEASRVTGGSNTLTLTGQLGSVMKESAKIAFNWFKSVTYKYGLDEYMEHIAEGGDVHIHFPAGAVSKDGPSAGITIGVALVSLFSNTPIVPDLALTGELTLRGSVLPVGGIKEKLIAAHNAGMKTVIIPQVCRKHLLDIPATVLDNLNIVLVDNMDEVIRAAFNGQIVSQKSSMLTSKL